MIWSICEKSSTYLAELLYFNELQKKRKTAPASTGEGRRSDWKKRRMRDAGTQQCRQWGKRCNSWEKLIKKIIHIMNGLFQSDRVKWAKKNLMTRGEERGEREREKGKMKGANYWRVISSTFWSLDRATWWPHSHTHMWTIRAVHCSSLSPLEWMIRLYFPLESPVNCITDVRAQWVKCTRSGMSSGSISHFTHKYTCILILSSIKPV